MALILECDGCGLRGSPKDVNLFASDVAGYRVADTCATCSEELKVVVEEHLRKKRSARGR